MSSRDASERFTRPSAARLRIYLLGPPDVEWAGHALTIPRRRARALLHRLAVRLQAVPRESLCCLFWPDTPESVARRNLSHLLTHLRQALPAPEALLVTEDCVSLDPQYAWSDTAAVERLWADTEAGGQTETLQQAVDLYRGPFLDGFSVPDSPDFDAWATLERRAWEHLYLKALAALVEHCRADGAYSEAIACARRYLAIDDLAEEMHRHLIALYALTGERGAALRQFEDCTAILERELGVSPLPETRAVYQTVLEGRALPRPRPVVTSGWATLPSLEAPLVGRDRAMQQLAEAYRRARSGHGCIAFISGEAGVGKSRLMQDFATHVQDQALVLVGAGREGMQPAPFQALVQALRSGLDVEQTVFNIQPCWLAEASRLLPELRNRHPDLSPVAAKEPGEARLRLLEALCQLILSLAAGPHPVLLCLDDVQWTDGATLDWLADLGDRLSGQRILVCGTYRSEEADAVKELSRSLARRGTLVELKLHGLDQAGILELLRHTAGHLPGSEPLAARLHRATGGNPFLILETLRILMETGDLRGDLDRLEDLPLPDTVQAAVTARLQRLEPKSRQVIEAGAILGATFGFELVRRTAGRGELETIDGLDELVARQLLVEQPGEYRFIHDLTRRAVEVTIGPMRRQLLHRRAGQALEQLEPDAVAGLAYHFDSGGEAGKALHYHALAAQRAENLFAWGEAEKHQGRMLASLDRLDPACRRAEHVTQRAQVLAARADLRFLQGRLAERDIDLSALADLVEASGDEKLRLLLLIHRVRYLNYGGQYTEAIATAEAGLALAERLDDVAARRRLLAHIGLAHYSIGQPRPARAALESAQTMGGRQDDPEMYGRVHQFLGYVHFHLGNHAQALACHQEAYACSQIMGDRYRMAWNLMDIGFQYLKLGHWAESREHVMEGLALARQIGVPPAEAYALTLLGEWELYRGDYAAAAGRLQQALPMHQAAHNEHSVLITEEVTGVVFCRLGELLDARRWLARAIERARSIGHRRLLAGALIGLGLVEIADNRLFAARGCLAEAMELARESESWENLAKGLAALARAERQEGNLAGALGHAYEAVRVAQQHALPVCEMWGEMEAGLTLLARGEPASALEHAERAAALLPQAHEGWIGAEEVHRAYARVLRVMGRHAAAGEQARLAETAVDTKAGRIPDPDLRRRFLAAAVRDS